MAFDIATLNTRIGRAANTPTSLGWMRDNTKPSYRSYGLQNMAGYYWFQSNLSGWAWGTWNCNGTVHTSWAANCATNCRYSIRTVAGINCCQDAALAGNCNCNCVNNCNNCYTGACGGAVNLSGLSGQCDQCMQCDISGNCDSRAWLQPNCNCMQCNCACNCFGAGQCQAPPNCACNCK